MNCWNQLLRFISQTQDRRAYWLLCLPHLSCIFAFLQIQPAKTKIADLNKVVNYFADGEKKVCLTALHWKLPGVTCTVVFARLFLTVGPFS